MEYKNELGKSIKEIENELADREIKIVIVGMGANTGRMAHTYAMMMKSAEFVCVDINTLPKIDQNFINRLPSRNDGSIEDMGERLIANILKDASELRAYESDVFIETYKPYQEHRPRHKKLKGWQKQNKKRK